MIDTKLDSCSNLDSMLMVIWYMHMIIITLFSAELNPQLARST